MNRIIQANINSKSGTTKNQMDSFLNEIDNKLDNENNIFEKKTGNYITDYEEFENYSIILNINFIYANDANNFHTWLKDKIFENETLFKNAKTKIHDCMHGNDKNQPCMIGDIWNL